MSLSMANKEKHEREFESAEKKKAAAGKDDKKGGKGKKK